MNLCCCCGYVTSAVRVCTGLNLGTDRVLGTDLAARYNGVVCYDCYRGWESFYKTAIWSSSRAAVKL